MLHCNCTANGIKTHKGLLGLKKLSDDHFQNGWHWLNEMIFFFFCAAPGRLQNVHLSRSENQVAKKRDCVYSGISEERNTFRSENISALGRRMPELGRERFLPLPQLFPIRKHFTVQTRMWSDDLRESKWQSDSSELERQRQGKMRNRGEGGEETWRGGSCVMGRDAASYLEVVPFSGLLSKYRAAQINTDTFLFFVLLVQEIRGTRVKLRYWWELCVRAGVRAGAQKPAGTIGSWQAELAYDCTNDLTPPFSASQDQLLWTSTHITRQANMLSRSSGNCGFEGDARESAGQGNAAAAGLGEDKAWAAVEAITYVLLPELACHHLPLHCQAELRRELGLVRIAASLLTGSIILALFSQNVERKSNTSCTSRSGCYGVLPSQTACSPPPH